MRWRLVNARLVIADARVMARLYLARMYRGFFPRAMPQKPHDDDETFVPQEKELVFFLVSGVEVYRGWHRGTDALPQIGEPPGGRHRYILAEKVRVKPTLQDMFPEEWGSNDDIIELTVIVQETRQVFFLNHWSILRGKWYKEFSIPSKHLAELLPDELQAEELRRQRRSNSTLNPDVNLLPTYRLLHAVLQEAATTMRDRTVDDWNVYHTTKRHQRHETRCGAKHSLFVQAMAIHAPTEQNNRYLKRATKRDIMQEINAWYRKTKFD